MPFLAVHDPNTPAEPDGASVLPETPWLCCDSPATPAPVFDSPETPIDVIDFPCTPALSSECPRTPGPCEESPRTPGDGPRCFTSSSPTPIMPPPALLYT